MATRPEAEGFIQIIDKQQLKNWTNNSVDITDYPDPENKRRRVKFVWGTQSTRAWIAVAQSCASETTIHTAFFIEGPVEIAKVKYKYCMIHLVPDKDRSETG